MHVALCALATLIHPAVGFGASPDFRRPGDELILVDEDPHAVHAHVHGHHGVLWNDADLGQIGQFIGIGIAAGCWYPTCVCPLLALLK